MNDNNKQIIKILLVGEQAVGKSSLMCRYVDDTFNLNMMGTAGLDLKKKIVQIGDKEILVYIYDIAGQERFRVISNAQYKNMNGVIVIYDVTDHKSYDCVSSWIASLNKYADSAKEIILIGNKIDLKEQIVVSTQEGEKLAQYYNCPFIETSAKDSINVEEGFLRIIYNIYRKSLLNNNKNPITSNNIERNRKDKPSGCCYAST